MVAQKIEQPPEQLFQATRTVHPPLRPRIALARQREMNAQFKEWVDIVSTVSYPWPLPLVGVPTCFTEVRHMKKKSTTVAEMRRLLDNMPDDALLVFKDREQKFQKMTPFDIGYLPHKHQNKKQRKDTRRQLRIVEGFKNQKEILKFATTNEAGGVARYFKGAGLAVLSTPSTAQHVIFRPAGGAGRINLSQGSEYLDIEFLYNDGEWRGYGRLWLATGKADDKPVSDGWSLDVP